MEREINSARRFSGHEVHAIRNQRTGLKMHLSELIGTVHLTNYNGGDLKLPMDLELNPDRWIKIQWMRSSEASSHMHDEIASRPFKCDRTVINPRCRFD